jgi:hypothetical protein
MNDGANRRQEVDQIVKSLGIGEVPNVPEITASLMQDFRNLDKNSHAERDAFKRILASNVLLAKAVGQLVQEVALMKREINNLKNRRN